MCASKGIILVNTLLLLFLISTGILLSIESSGLQSRLTANTTHRIKAEMLAESALIAKQYEWEGVAVSTAGILNHVQLHWVSQPIQGCQQKAYLLKAHVDYHRAVVETETYYVSAPLQWIKTCTKVWGKLWWNSSKDI